MLRFRWAWVGRGVPPPSRVGAPGPERSPNNSGISGHQPTVKHPCGGDFQDIAQTGRERRGFVSRGWRCLTASRRSAYGWPSEQRRRAREPLASGGRLYRPAVLPAMRRPFSGRRQHVGLANLFGSGWPIGESIMSEQQPFDWGVLTEA